MSSENLDLIKRRRQLLKAAVGAPTVMTVAFGSSQAAASTGCRAQGVLGEGEVSEAVDGFGVPILDGDGNPTYVDGQGRPVVAVIDGDGVGGFATTSCAASLGVTTASADLSRIA